MTEPEAWTIDHKVTWFAQIRTRPGPVDGKGDQWAENEHTGLVLAVCNCGLNTGWIPKADMPSREALNDGDQHAALMTKQVLRIELTGADREFAAFIRKITGRDSGEEDSCPT